MPSPLRARALRTLAAVLLLVALLVPGSAPALAADGEPLVLQAARTRTSGPQPVAVGRWSSTTRSSRSTTTCSSASARTSSRCPGSPSRGSSPTDGLTWTFHIRPGMKWSDGEPATSEDARWTYQLVLDAAETETATSARATSSRTSPTPASTAVEAPDAETLVVTTEFPNTLLLQAYVPILPKHIWSEYTLEQIGDPSADGFFANEPPVVGTGPYQAVEWEPGEFIRFAAQPELLGRAGCRGRGRSSSTSPSRDTMVQALKTGELDYVRGVQRRPVRRAEERAEDIVDRRGRRQRLHRALLQHRRQQARATAARRRRWPTRRSATRSATRSTSDASSRRPRRHGDAGHDDHPAVPRALARRAGQPAHLRHRGGEAPARRRRLRARRRQRGSTRTASRSTCA